MKKNKVLAVALSAGLVLGGAYALEETNVAYAAEETKSVEEQKAELEAQIKDLENANTDKEKEIETLKNQKTDTTQPSKDLEKAKTTQSSAQEEYNSENAKYEKLEAKHKDSKANREKLDQELKEAREAAGKDPFNYEPFKKVEQLRAERDAAQTQEDEDRVAANNQKKVVDEKKNALDAANTAVNEKQEALNKAEQSNKDNQDKINKLNEEIKKNNKKIDELKKKIANLKPDEKPAEKDYKEKAKEIVDNNVEAGNITEEEGKKYKERIDNTNIDLEANAILKELYNNIKNPDKDPEKPDEKPVEKDYKEKAKEIVDNNVKAGNITEEEGEEYKKRIDNTNIDLEANVILREIYNKYKDNQKDSEEPGEEKPGEEKPDPNDPTTFPIFDDHELKEDEEKPGEDENPGITIDEWKKTLNESYGYDTEEEAIEVGKEVLKDKKLQDLYDVEAKQGYDKDGNYGKWFFRFVPKEEVKEEEEKDIPLKPLTPAEEIEKPVDEEEKPCKPCPEFPIIPGPIAPDTVIPGPIVEDTVVVPGPVVPTPEEKPEVKPSEDIDKLIKEIEQGTKDIENTLIENEKNQKEEEKKPEEDKKPEDKKPEDKKPAEKEKEKEVVAPKAAPKTNNPKTGVAGMSAVAGTLAISMAGIVATRKKNN